MAQKRMIDKKISVSEQVADLTIEAQLIFTWSIPHSDDLGLLPSSPRTLKAMVVPMWDINMEDFGNHVEDIVQKGLYVKYEHLGNTFLRVVKFANHQTLKKDRKPITLLDDIENWDDVAGLGFHLEDIGKPREEKRREEKRSNSTKSTKKISVVKFSSDDMRMVDLLVELIVDRTPLWQMRGSKDVWAEHIEKLHRIDGRSYEQIEGMIRWVQQDKFWCQNILSTSKLREKFNSLLPKLQGAYDKSRESKDKVAF